MSDVVRNGQVSGLLFLHAQTALHPGSGTAPGVVDLPVQRERHTQWPLIPGSSLKGVLRDCCRQQVAGKRAREADADPDLTAAFGSPAAAAERHAGALSVTDARILAFPVRSLRGVFAWATCPAVLQRLARDVQLAGLPSPFSVVEGQGVTALKADEALCAADSSLLVDGNKVVLEEFEFKRAADAGEAADWIAAHAVNDPAAAARVKSHLAVLSDDDFTHFVRHATEVVARVGLDYERKTIKPGAVFYQEFLPAETLFYSVVFVAASRREGDATPAAAILAYLQEHIERAGVIQIGSDETTGKGLCLARLCHGKEN
jgi:CRISPR-associated protein Cmr4